MKYSIKIAFFLIMAAVFAGSSISPASTTVAAVTPSISFLSPSYGPAGTVVRIYSPLTNPFTPTGNTITFYSTSTGMFMYDSKPNVSTQNVPGQKYLLYTIPNNLMVAGTSTIVSLFSGFYHIIVSNSNGTSSPKLFSVTSAPIITSVSSVIETSAGAEPAIKLIIRGNNFAPTNNIVFDNTSIFAWNQQTVSRNSDGSLFYVIPPFLNTSTYGTSTIVTPTGTYRLIIFNGNGSSTYRGINIINFPR